MSATSTSLGKVGAPVGAKSETAAATGAIAHTAAVKVIDSPADWVSRIRPSSMLIFLLGEFCVLGLLAVAYMADWWGVRGAISSPIAGVLPVSVPWGGALGGVCTAIAGVTDHWRSFGLQPASATSRTWNAWYLVRLPMGAAFGTIGALIVVFFLGTVGSTKSGTIDVSISGTAILFVVAFIVGYKQDIFRQLVSRVTEVILGPGDTQPAAAVQTAASAPAASNAASSASTTSPSASNAASSASKTAQAGAATAAGNSAVASATAAKVPD
ncbi:hypothetical protein [Rathayibacter soli]|uniref:hypothetical protein n=1 Tax=Rathayibacter soli TaxID=3144168 RepID=UPI0027E58EF3|nr:hypothetical protein [Glaciibacter superstes]